MIEVSTEYSWLFVLVASVVALAMLGVSAVLVGRIFTSRDANGVPQYRLSGALTGIAAVSAIAVLMIARVRDSHHQVLVSKAETNMAAQVADVFQAEWRELSKVGRPPWDSLPEELAEEVDTYSSPLVAARSLARTTADELKRGSSEEPLPTVIRVASFARAGDLDHDALKSEYAKTLQSELPKTTVLLDSDTRQGDDDNTMRVDVGVIGYSVSGSTRKRQRREGTVEARCRPAADRNVKNFAQIDWLSSFDDFATSAPDRAYLVGITPDTMQTAAEALEAAVADAREKLGIDRRQKDSEFASLFESGQLQVDHFQQRLQTDNGNAWRAAVLYDVSPANVAASGGPVGGALGRRLLAFIGLILFSGFLYLVLRAVTGSGGHRLVVISVIAVSLVIVLGVAVVLTPFVSRTSGSTESSPATVSASSERAIEKRTGR